MEDSMLETQGEWVNCLKWWVYIELSKLHTPAIFTDPVIRAIQWTVPNHLYHVI